MDRADDTIFALSSGAPPAAIAIVRVSGPQAFPAAVRLTGTLPPTRRAALRTLRDGNGAALDRALVLVFPAPNTATGEDLVELHLHGGRAVVAAVEGALAAMPGLRRAEPGEFTRRALTAGRIDLAEAEGLGDLLTAETEAQRRAAMDAAGGLVSRQIANWNDAILMAAAQIEAVLDFADEGDVDDDAQVVAGITDTLTDLAAKIDVAMANPPVERLRDGIRVVLAGAPNAGKSTLLNAMVGREAAIVSPIAGTTRDRIEAAVIRGGVAYLLIDTAGLAAHTDDPIERIGIVRAEQAMAAADIVLMLDETPASDNIPVLRVFPRVDEAGRGAPPPGTIAVSAVTGLGLDALWHEIAKASRDLLPRADLIAFNQRQQHHIAAARTAIGEAAHHHDPLLIADALRRARQAFDRVTGASDTEAMLDALFGRFCIGK